MRRSRKLFVFLAAAVVALALTVQRRNDDIRVAASASLSAEAAPSGGGYDLSRIPIFTRALYYVNNNYFDKGRIDPKRMLVGALDFLQRDVPEILIDRFPERDPKQVTVEVGGKSKVFSVEKVESPWALRAVLQDIFRFIQPNLEEVAPKDEAERLVEIERAATNGMLYTLDPHSVLLDVESFKDMRTTTQGKFGGLGIVIGMNKKNRIVVKRPMKGTPAMEAGIKANDEIVRINNESTVNMTLAEAVERLRGDVGSPVDVYVERPGTAGAKKYTIVRGSIRPPAIDPEEEVLEVPGAKGAPATKIGYFRIVNFSANTQSDLTRALRRFAAARVKGIVMDLRWNPGGLYDQAQKVADAFIDSGVLVSMVGVGGAQRKDEHATRDADVELPLAVLINHASASASEIVAGAIKHLDRGVVFGESTFGKGSVQVLFDVRAPVALGRTGEDRLGLKLTTAQYLTAGDVSIQGVGVIPDVEVTRMDVHKRDDRTYIRLQPTARWRQEADYEWHLPTGQKGAQPAQKVAFLWEPPPGKPDDFFRDEDDERTDEDEEEEPEVSDVDQNPKDYMVLLARDFLAQGRGARRRAMLGEGREFFDRARAVEDRKLSAALEQMGVDWSPAPAGTPRGELEIRLEPAAGSPGKIPAGELAKIRGIVRNLGKTPVYRVRGKLASTNPFFDENELVFGKVAPGETRTYDLVVKVPRTSLTRADLISATVAAAGDVTANQAELLLEIAGKARPRFAYGYQTVDDVVGNRDGKVQKGERVRLLVKVKNVGQGPALTTQAILRNGAGQQGILISAGRFEAKELAPGATRDFAFVYEVTQDFEGEEYELDLSVADTIFNESVADRIKFTLAPPGPSPVAGGAAGAAPATVTTWQVMPPILTATAPTIAPGASVHVKGQVTDDRQVKDVFIRVWNRDSKLPAKKVFYQPNRGTPASMTFEADVPLWPGSNLIQVFARETNEVQSVQTLVVFRKDGAARLVRGEIQEGQRL